MSMSSTVEASVFIGKNYSENLHSIKNTRWDLTLKQMDNLRRFLECLKSAGKIIHGNCYLWSMMKKVISLSHAKVHVFSDSVFMSWKDESEPNIKYCLERQVDVVQNFITIQNFGHN